MNRLAARHAGGGRPPRRRTGPATTSRVDVLDERLRGGPGPVRLRLGARQPERHRLAGAGGADGLRPDADRHRRRRRGHRPADGGRARRARRIPGEPAARGRPRPGGRGAADRQVRAAVRHLRRPRTRSRASSPGSPSGSTPTASRGRGADRRRWRPGPPPPRPRTPSSASSCAPSCGRTRRRRTRSAVERYTLGVPRLPRRHRRSRGDLPLGLAGVPGHRGRAARGGASGSRRGRDRQRGRDGAGRRRRGTRSPASTRCSRGCRTCPTGPSTTWPTSTSRSRDPIRNLECLIAPPGGGIGAYYTGAERRLQPAGPDVVGRRAGPRGVLHLAGDQRPSTTRACPGHHLQIATAVYRRDRLNDYQRLLAGTSGHAEGWALYAERLVRELGYLRRRRAAARAARLAAVPRGPGDRRHRHAPGAGDPGRHRLPRGRALDRRARPGVPAHPDDHRAGALRPTRSTATWAGPARRRRTRSASGSGSPVGTTRAAGTGTPFDLKAFHTAALGMGGMGLDPLAAQLAKL